MSLAETIKSSRSWNTLPLDEVFEVVGGGTPSKKKASYFGGDIPWATIRDMHSDTLSQTDHTITVEGLRASSAKVIPSGEVIMASRVGLGKACLLSQDTAINQDIRALLPRKTNRVNRRFCLYWLQSIEDTIIAAGSGATVQGIKLPFIKSLPFPDISLEDQERIVAVLDQAFAALDRARVLAEANLADAEELFENCIRSTFGETKEVPRIALEDCAEIVSGYSFSSRDFDAQNPVKSIKITNVGVKTFVEADTEKLPDKYLSEFSKFSVPAGAIVIALTRSIIAGGLKVAVVPECFAGALLNQRVAAVKVHNDRILRDYLYMFLASPVVVKYVQEKANTLMQPNFSINDLRQLQVPLPEAPIRQELVDTMNQLTIQRAGLQRNYQANLKDIDDLRQSLLQKAFAGELT